MLFNFNRNDSPVSVAIISISCCVSGMAAFDEQARRIVGQAVSETGVEAKVKVIPASSAIFGGIPRDVLTKLMTEFNQSGFNKSGRMGVPVILVNGKAISYGVPDVETVKSALLETVKSKKIKEENTNE